MEQTMIETKTVKEKLDKVLALKAEYEREMARLKTEMELANRTFDKYRVSQLTPEVQKYKGWIKGIDDALLTLEPLFKLVEPKEVK